MTTTNLREIAIDLINNTNLSKESSDKAIIIFGSSNSGKSTLINRWLGKNINSDRKAPGLDYLWSRKGYSVCHVWEMPELVSSKLISAIFQRGRVFSSVFFVIVLDLSKPNLLSSTVQQIFSSLESFDGQFILIGSKYDIFQNLESDMKKKVCRFLRGLALTKKDAYLVFYSNDIPALVRRLKDLLNIIVWNSSDELPSKGLLSKDYHTPLYILPNSDSWDELDVGQCSFEQLCNIYDKQIHSK